MTKWLLDLKLKIHKIASFQKSMAVVWPDIQIAFYQNRLKLMLFILAQTFKVRI